jgi:branched-chain amino acid transport system permease protein
MNFWLAMIVAAVVAGVFGVFLGAPTLRLRGDYLAIVTLGFGEIVPLVIRNAHEITKGTQGMKPIGFPEVPGVRFGAATEPWYFLVLGILLLSIFLTSRLRTSRIGRAWMAIREDEVAASSIGINPVTTKLFAFSLGASFSGFAGSVWASYLQVISPDQFQFSVSIFVLLMIVIGGMGNIPGVIVGGLILGGFDRVLTDAISGSLRGLGSAFDIDFLRRADISRLRTLIYGTALVVLMLVRPEGILPSARRKMELHAADEDEGEAAQSRESLFESQR